MKVRQTIAWVADMDEAVRKQWNNRNRASTEAQHEIIQSFMNSKKSDFS
ncbi:protein of unknown function (plasmid) [Vibrio harveyi]|nr:protein of unknown function [Vibrio harveyi]CAH1586571.1 protein of unknown function [Vibrio harveyi]CAH1592884.1 protein of unknown function [Vibrio harveyi]